MTIVRIKLPTAAAVEHGPNVPFMVWTPDYPERSSMYRDEPDLVAQMAPGETEAAFQAKWVDGEWMFGRRVYNGSC